MMRFEALQESRKRTQKEIEPSGKRSELFGKNVFNEEKMLQFLTNIIKLLIVVLFFLTIK